MKKYFLLPIAVWGICACGRNADHTAGAELKPLPVLPAGKSTLVVPLQDMPVSTGASHLRDALGRTLWERIGAADQQLIYVTDPLPAADKACGTDRHRPVPALCEWSLTLQ